MSIIGLDIGTTGCKAITFGRNGNILGQGAREYAISTPRPDWAEQDAEGVWQLAWAALSESSVSVSPSAALSAPSVSEISHPASIHFFSVLSFLKGKKSCTTTRSRSAIPIWG